MFYRVLVESQNSSTPSQGSIPSYAFPSRDKFISLPPPPQKLRQSDADEVRHPMAPLNQNTSSSRDTPSRRFSNPKVNQSPVSVTLFLLVCMN